MKKLLSFLSVIFLLIGATSVFGAAVTKQIYFEKATEDAELFYCAMTTSNDPPCSQTHHFRFSLYDAEAAGSQVWSEEADVTLDANVISHALGSVTTLTGVDFVNKQLWVEVEWQKPDLSWKVIDTRDRFGVVPYALWSFESTSGSAGFDADTVDGEHASFFALATHTHNYDSSYVNVTGDTMTGSLIMDTGASGDLTLSEDGIAKAGDLTIDANSSDSDTTISILNSDEVYKANLNIEGNISAANFTGDGSGLDNVIPAAHNHSGADVTSGTVSEARIDSTIARDSEVTSAVSTHSLDASAHHTKYSDAEAVSAIKAADGPGSTLDADLLDGNDSTAFAGAGHAHNYDSSYVNVTGDTMSGDLLTSGIISSAGFRTGDYVIDSTGIRTIYTDIFSNSNPAINIIPGTDDLPGLPGDVNIKGSWAGNDAGGNVTVGSGNTSPWKTAGGHSKTTLSGGDISGRANTGSKIELQGGISAGGGSENVSGGTITISGGIGNGTGPGGNIIILPGSGGTSGNVGIGTTNPSAELDVTGTVKATAFSGDGSGLDNVIPAAHNHSGGDITSGTVDTTRLNVGSTSGTVAAGDHSHDYDSNYVNATGDSMTGTLNASVNLGSGNAIYATNSGIGAASNAVSGINTGTGHAGNFEITNAGNSNVALFATTNGSGNAIRAQTSGNGDALYSYTSGFGRAGLFQIGNASNSSEALYATTNGAGYAGYFSGGGGLYVNPMVKSPQFTSRTPGENLSVKAADGTASGGVLTVSAGSAGSATGGSGGNLNLQAGGNMPQGGAGYGNLGPTGNVNITAGSGYNTVGGNVSIASGATSFWSLSHPVYSKVSILGGAANGGDGASIDVEGGHSPVMSAVSSGGNVLITGGNAVGGYTGGNIILTPGTGSPNGLVGIGTSSPGAKLDVLGEIRTNNQLISTIPTGIAPLQVASTTMVANLNSEMLGGYKIADLDTRYGQSVPGQVPSSNTLSIVLPSGTNDGLYSAITIGTDGIPVVAYYDASKGYLMAGKCSNSACTSFSNYTYAAGSQGHISIAIGTDGLPIMSHLSGGALTVAKCANTSCTSFSSNTPLAGSQGHTSIAIGTDGLPVISHLSGGLLRVAKCANTNCTALSNNMGITGSGGYTSIAIGTDGFPFVSHYAGSLCTLKCTTADCSGGSLNCLGAASVGNTSTTIGTDRLPIISYISGANVCALKCADTSCSALSSNTCISASNTYNSITMGADGLPAIAYYTGGAMGVVKCGNASCSSNNTVTTVDSSANVGQYNSITMGTDSNPVISYYDVSTGELKVAKCANQFCINNWSRR